MTKTSAVMGSPLYMSPEQMTASRQVDARTDIWAIGVVLYELLTGRVPFSAETLPEICGLILTAAPPAVRDYAPAVPDGLQNVVRRCLEKDRERRFANVSELAYALSPFGSRATSRSVERIARILGASSVLEAMPPSGPAPAQANFGPSTQSNWGQTKPSRPSAMPLVATAFGVVLLLGGVGAFLLFRGTTATLPTLAGSGQPASAEAIPSAAPAPLAEVPAAAVAAPPLTAAASAVTPATSAARVVAKSPPPSPAANLPKVALKIAPVAKPAAVVTPVPVVASQPAAVPAKTKRSADDLLSGRN
jgi:serine/threonine-protein kinase